MTSNTTDVGNAADESDPKTDDCDRCGDPVSIGNASQLEKQDNKALRKILCPDCLRAAACRRDTRSSGTYLASNEPHSFHLLDSGSG